MSRTTIAAGAALAAAVLATTALAARDPKALALRKSDVPAGAVQLSGGPTVHGPQASFYTVTYDFRRPGGEEEVTSFVSVSPTAKATEAVYRRHVAVNSGLPGTTVVKLPAYGDEQYAAFLQGPKRGGYSRARAEAVVRKGHAVWDLTVESCGPWAPFGCHWGRTPPNLTKAQAVSELRKYAAKQKARVGTG